MKILVIHLGEIRDILPSTSVLKSICRKIKDPEIIWVIKDKKNKYIFNYNKRIDRILSFNELKKTDEVFDLLINLYPYFPHWKCPNLRIRNAFDFNFQHEAKDLGKVLLGEIEAPNTNLFQIAHKLSGLLWKGDGYDLCYFPRTRSKPSRIGLAVAQSNLRVYINDNLDLEGEKLWQIPYKTNIFKRMDEINRCSKIITDDLTTFHLSMYLRKYVYFLEIFPSNFKMELFGKGEIHRVPKEIFL